MLPQFQGKGVTLLGTAGDVAEDGMSFNVRSSDDNDVQVLLGEPLQEYIQGTVEVHGVVTPDNSVQCTNYILFPSADGQPFDAGSYNRAVALAHQLANHYIQKAEEVQ